MSWNHRAMLHTPLVHQAAAISIYQVRNDLRAGKCGADSERGQLLCYGVSELRERKGGAGTCEQSCKTTKV